FFSSRRRHTRFSRDWSSDVCSSDLAVAEGVEGGEACVGIGEIEGARRCGGAEGKERAHPRESRQRLVEDRDRALGVSLAELGARSEEHTSELQSRENLVCRLLFEKI